MNNIEGTVKFVRLNNGEDLISYVYHVPKDDVEEGHYILNNPLKIVYVPKNKGEKTFLSISLMEWIFSRISTEQEFKVLEKEILLVVEPNANLVEYYYQTIDHFAEARKTIKPSFEATDSLDDDEEGEFDEDDYLEENEALDAIKDLLNNMSIDKKKLN